MLFYQKNLSPLNHLLIVFVVFFAGCGPGQVSLTGDPQNQKQTEEELLNTYTQASDCQQQAQLCRESCFSHDDIQVLHQAVQSCKQDFTSCIGQQQTLLECGQGLFVCVKNIGVKEQAVQFGECIQLCGQDLGFCLHDLDSFDGLEDLENLGELHKQCLEQAPDCLQPCQTDLEGCLQSLVSDLEQVTECIKDSSSKLMNCIGLADTEWIWVDPEWAAEKLVEAGQSAIEVATFLMDKLRLTADVALDIIRTLYNMSLHDALEIFIDSGLTSAQWAAEKLVEAGYEAVEIANFLFEKLQLTAEVALNIIGELYDMSMHDAVQIIIDAGIESAQWAAEKLKAAGKTAAEVAKFLVERLQLSLDVALNVIRAVFNMSLHDALCCFVDAGVAGAQWIAQILAEAGQTASEVAKFIVERLLCSTDVALDIIQTLYNLSLHDAVQIMINVGIASTQWAAEKLKQAGQTAIEIATFLVQELKCSAEVALDIIHALYNMSLHDAVQIMIDAGIASAQWAVERLKIAGQTAVEVVKFLVHKLNYSADAALDAIRALYNLSLHDAIECIVQAGLAGTQWAAEKLKQAGQTAKEVVRFVVQSLGQSADIALDIIRALYNLSLHDAVDCIVQTGLTGAQWAAEKLKQAGQTAKEVAKFVVQRLKQSTQVALDIIKTLYNLSLHDAVDCIVNAGLEGVQWAVQTLKNMGANVIECLEFLIQNFGINSLSSLRDILRNFFGLSDICHAIVDRFGLGPIAKGLCMAGDIF